jgi:hypothetical protein
VILTHLVKLGFLSGAGTAAAPVVSDKPIVTQVQSIASLLCR